MEIEFIIAPPLEIDTAMLEKNPALGRAFARRDVQASPAPDGYVADWFTRFGVARQNDWPAAPFRLAPEEAGEHYWLCADPIYLQFDRDRVLFDPQAMSDLGATEAQELIALLNAHFAQDDLQFRALTPQNWLLRVPRKLDLRIPAPELAAGRPAGTVLPQGADAAWARRASNEVQMLLHQAPLNASRENRRLWPVNSVWLWGGGTFPKRSASPAKYDITVLSPVEHVRGLVRWAGGQSAPLPGSWQEIAPFLRQGQSAKLLIDLTETAFYGDWLGALQAAWLGPAELAEKTQKLTFSCTLFHSGFRLYTRLYHRDLFHFFCRKSLAGYVHKRQN